VNNKIKLTPLGLMIVAPLLISGALISTTQASPTQTSQNQAKLISPLSGSIIQAGAALTLTFSSGGEMWLDVGTSYRASDVKDSKFYGSSYTIEEIPSGVDNLYLTLWTRSDQSWVPHDYLFKVEGQVTQPKVPVSLILEPKIGSKLKVDEKVTFVFEKQNDLWLEIGSEEGSSDIENKTLRTESYTLQAVPDIAGIYLTVWTKPNGEWEPTPYHYEIITDAMDTDPIQQRYSIASTDQIDFIDAIDSESSIEPTAPVEPGESIDPTTLEYIDPIDSTQEIELTDFIDPSQPVAPVESIELTEPVEFIESTVSADTLDPNSLQGELLAAVNTARSIGRNCGSTYYPATTPVVHHQALTLASEEHTSNMANYNFFSQTGIDGLSYDDRAKKHGYEKTWAGENIAAGQIDVESVMESWLISEGHCSHIMNPRHVDFGASMVRNAGSEYEIYWSLLLGY